MISELMKLMRGRVFSAVVTLAGLFGSVLSFYSLFAMFSRPILSLSEMGFSWLFGFLFFVVWALVDLKQGL